MASTASKRRPKDWVALSAWFLWVVLIGASAYLISKRHPDMTVAWVPTHDLPAYHLIVDTEVVTTTVTLADYPSDAVPAETSPVASYTRQSLTAEKTIRLSQLVSSNDTALVHGTVPVSIPATAAMTINGQLSPGAVVTVWSLSHADESDSVTARPLLKQVLVLYVQHFIPEPGKESDAGALPYVVVLAIPADRQAEVLAVVAAGSLALTFAP